VNNTKLIDDEDERKKRREWER